MATIRIKTPPPTMIPTISPVLFFLLVVGLLLTVGMKSVEKLRSQQHGTSLGKH